MAQHTIQMPIIEDTYIDMNSPGTNYGSSTELRAGGGNTTPYYPNYKQETLLKWDKPLIPERKKIVARYLYLYSISQLTTQCYLYSVGPKEFSEMATTWNSLKGSPPLTWVSNDVLRAPYANNSYAKFDVTDIYDFRYRDKCIFGAEDKQSTSRTLVFSSRESSSPPYIEVTYEDVPPNAPTPTEPIGAYKDSKSITRFAWTYNSDVGGEQKAFDLQWSIDQSTWTTVSQTTPNNYYDMPADTLPTSNIYWRVRTYNEYDEVGPYSDVQSFYAIGAPTAPALNTVPTDTARPVITWSAFSQQVYQLQVLSGNTVVYDSGITPGINARQHKVKTWLADGSYTVRLRIKNEYDLWSEWGSAAVAISTVKPDKPSLSIQRSAHGVEISATGLVYRSDYGKDDYICIGTAAGTFYDNTVKNEGEYKYFVRAVSEDDTYNDSDIKFIQAEFQHALIAPVSDLTNVFAFSKSLNAPPKRIYNNQPGGAQVQYAGRTHPVWEPDEHISAAWSMGGYYLDTWSEVEDFVALCDSKKTVLYRDARGRKMYGTLGNLSVSDELMGYTVSFTISQVDYDESVEV